MLTHVIENCTSDYFQDCVDKVAVQKLEGQTWIALYNLLSKPLIAEKYSVNEYRRSVLMRLLGRINDDVINQVSK